MFQLVGILWFRDLPFQSHTFDVIEKHENKWITMFAEYESASNLSKFELIEMHES